VFTLDIYKRWIDRDANDRQLVRVGIVSSAVVLLIAIVLGGFIGKLGGNLFVYIQTLYAFFAPPFSAIFLKSAISDCDEEGPATTAILMSSGRYFLLSIALEIILG